jgi:hypothetical protein
MQALVARAKDLIVSTNSLTITVLMILVVLAGIVALGTNASSIFLDVEGTLDGAAGFDVF